MMTTNWVEEGALADMKNRLDKIRVDQSRHKHDDEQGKKDTLKILQSKFGSPVYDPTSPLQKAYDRRCARSGRRKSIEFEDLYLKKGSGLLHLPTPLGAIQAKTGRSTTTTSGSATPRKHPLYRSSSGMDYSSQLSQLHSNSSQAAGNTTTTTSPSRVRKSSDPSSHFRKDQNAHGSKTKSAGASPSSSEHGGGGSAAGGGQKVGQGESEGHRGQGHRGILHVTVSEEEKKAIDRKLAGVMEGAVEEGGPHHVTAQPPRKKKVSKSSSGNGGSTATTTKP